MGHFLTRNPKDKEVKKMKRLLQSIRLWKLVMLLLPIPLLGANCPSRTTEWETISISPALMETIEVDRWCPDLGSWHCGLREHGCAPNKPDPAIGVAVGYDRYYYPGTNPFPCPEAWNSALRGWIYFDTSPINNKRIFSAKLNWNRDTQQTIGNVATPEGNCAAGLYKASMSRGPNGKLFNFPESGTDISETVRFWAVGREPNDGLLFIGPIESLGHKNNDRCISTLSNFKLEVRVAK